MINGDNGVDKIFFKLKDSFIENYKDKQPEWGYGGLGYTVYKRTYARRLNGSTEEFWQTLRRVVEGVFTIQKRHCIRNLVPWSELKAQNSAQKMFKLMWEFKFLPPGRGLWMMGTDYVYKRGGMSLNNCGFVSTQNITTNFAEPFCFLMDACMLGVGVGADTKGAGKMTVREPKISNEAFLIPDTREGWVEALRKVLNAFSGEGELPASFDSSLIRPYGEPINGFGGTASGPGPLLEMLADVEKVLRKRIGEKITSTDIVDIFNLIGRCVVAGNVRRTAEIMFGEQDDEEFLNLKNPEMFKTELLHHRWASNNSIFAKVGMDYSKVAELTAKNGEPGYEWLDNARAFSRMGKEPDNKDYRAGGGNPCLEQTLEPYELCCVTGDTRIQTRSGLPKIKDVVGKTVEVWNGVCWSKVKPFKAGKNKKILRVYISDGSYLDCDKKHEFLVRERTKRRYVKKYAKNLKPGDTLPEYSLEPDMGGKHVENAYEYGLFAGDGCVDKNNPILCIGGDKNKLKNKIKGKWYKPRTNEYNKPMYRVSMKNILDLEMCRQLRQKELPEDIFSWDSNSIMEFIAGYIDSDGSVGKYGNTHNYRIFGLEQKMRDLQILCRRIGINHATVNLMSKKGTKTNFGTRNEDLWFLYIPTYECAGIPTRLKIATKFGSGLKNNNAHVNGRQISYKRRQKIVGITEKLQREDTYCFTEPMYNMGVFGNVLTFQCLVETFPVKHNTLEEWIETLKYAYLYAKTVTLIPTHNKLTNAVMLRNRRIGCSISGITQAFKKFGRRHFFEKIDEGYKRIQDWDKTFSDWMCIPRSIKMTSIKPSGTVSLLPGVTPGIHYPISEYYIRNVRFMKGSKLLEKLEKAGYLVEKDKYTDNTYVVSFPIKEEYFERSVNDVSMWEQLENVAQIQEHWADNQVSVTVSFKDYEAKDIKYALELYETRLKGVSFLPIKDHGYEQAPYIPITEKEFKNLRRKIKDKNLLGKITNSIHEIDDKFCDSTTCEIEVELT